MKILATFWLLLVNHFKNYVLYMIVIGWMISIIQVALKWLFYVFAFVMFFYLLIFHFCLYAVIWLPQHQLWGFCQSILIASRSILVSRVCLYSYPRVTENLVVRWQKLSQTLPRSSFGTWYLPILTATR